MTNYNNYTREQENYSNSCGCSNSQRSKDTCPYELRNQAQYSEYNRQY